MQSRILAAAIALAAPFAARAETGAEIGLRTGFAVPFGKIDGTASGSLSDLFTGFIPIGIDLGWRFTPNFSAGLAGKYAFGITTNCPSGDRCSGHDVSLGLELRYHVQPDQRFDPWVGIGAGYEWLSVSETSGGNTVNVGADGFEFVHAQVGADFTVSNNVRIGPFVQLTLGQYKSENASVNGGPTRFVDVTNKALHEFLTFGVRVIFLP